MMVELWDLYHGDGWEVGRKEGKQREDRIWPSVNQSSRSLCNVQINPQNKSPWSHTLVGADSCCARKFTGASACREALFFFFFLIYRKTTDRLVVLVCFTNWNCYSSNHLGKLLQIQIPIQWVQSRSWNPASQISSQVLPTAAPWGKLE